MTNTIKSKGRKGRKCWLGQEEILKKWLGSMLLNTDVKEIKTWAKNIMHVYNKLRQQSI